MLSKVFSSTQKAYLAGFLDGDGSIYVKAKPNPTYKFGFQIAPYVVLFQSAKDKTNFEKICSLIGFGHLRERKDGILEYIISRTDDILKFLDLVEPFLILKKSQLILAKKIIKAKSKVKNRNDFAALMKKVDSFRELNYSKKRKIRKLTP